MALEITGIRRDGVYGGEWNYPVRILTAYHIAAGAGSVLVANGASFVPTAGREYWMGTPELAADPRWELEVHDGAGYIVVVDSVGVAGAHRTGLFHIYQSVDDGTGGTWRVTNNTGAADRMGYTWRQMM